MDAGYTPVTLPSRGILYEGQIPEGRYELRKMTAQEDALIFQSGGASLAHDRINRVINACAKLPNGFDPLDLLLTDRMAILLSLRIITFGAQYSIPYRCSYCRNQGKFQLNVLEDLNQTEAEDGLEEPIDVMLDDVGKLVSMRFLRGRDEERVMKRSKRLMMQSNDASDQSYYHRMALQIVAIDGDTSRTLADVEDFIRSLSAADVARMRNAVDKQEPGIDLRVYPVCKGCGAMNEMMLPFTAEFFRPSDI